MLTEAAAPLGTAFERHPDYRLFVTGHSLGAGSALLVTMDMLRKQQAKSSESIVPIDAEVKCVALAPPPVYR